MKKPFPEFKTDSDAERFVESADLSDYDFTDMTSVRFELRRKDKTISLRLPETLLAEVRSQAERAGIPYQRFIRLTLERALQRVS